MADDIVMPISLALTALVAALTIPSLIRLAKISSWNSNSIDHGLYEDTDGLANENSMAKYSTRRFFILLFGAAATGLLLFFSLALFITVRIEHTVSEKSLMKELWLLFAAWILSSLQLLSTSKELRPVVKFQRGMSNSISCFIIMVMACSVLLRCITHRSGNIVLIVMSGGQIAASLTMISVLFSIERRPDVFRPNGKAINREFTSSIWNRWSFSWISELLDLASTRTVEAADLPALSAHARSIEVVSRFKAQVFHPSVPLWRLLFHAFRVELLSHWSLVALSSVFDIAPQYATLSLLQYLESRDNFSPIDSKAWLSTGGLFFGTFASAIISSKAAWLMRSQLTVPMRSLLTTLVFEKMLRIQDCKGPPASETEAKKDSAPNTVKARLQQTERDAITVFSVDTNLVANLASNMQLYVYFVFKLIACAGFLFFLLGWQSLLVGIAWIALFIPINKYLGNRYGSFQEALMDARDQKLKVITEVLNSIRQIKFSASETQWTEKIYQTREVELDKIWQTKLNEMFMMIGSDISPVFLTVLVLGTHTYVYGELLPSVAFTALNVFLELEIFLGMIPELITIALDAKVSTTRIDKFLKSEERVNRTSPGESIAFEKASFGFPLGSSKSKDHRFILHDVNLDFPNNALSVISGPIGSGKSLLLAAILGEVDMVSGLIRVPKSHYIDHISNRNIGAADWLTPGAIAFVSQNPWLENCSIKNNILFGLPFHETRYKKAIDSCALAQDLGMFDDGDMTEVGAQGINISGGQKWRVTLARALYSRASVLLLDDVFSSLDTHVGKDIFDNALMGELAEGRTRILVTHHVSLCLPRAKYAVGLTSRGGVEYAGLMEDLRHSGTLMDILATEDGTNALPNDNEAPTESKEPGHENGLVAKHKAVSHVQKTPRKLVDDEKMEVGRVKFTVYSRYWNATGGLPIWMLIILFYIVAQGLYLGRSWWIKIWTSDYDKSEAQSRIYYHPYPIRISTVDHGQISQSMPSREQNSLGYYLGVYILISLIWVVISLARLYFLYIGSLRASRNVFKDMTYNVLRTPLRWLDTIPTGRIVNRFMADFQSLDLELSRNFAQAGASFLNLSGIVVAVLFVSPYIILFAIVLFVFCVPIARCFVLAARSFKRLESTQRSPIISHFSSSLQGLTTIRAFSNSSAYISKMHNLADTYTEALWHNYLFQIWFSFRMSIISSIFATTVAIFVVLTRSIDAGLAGFALSFALEFRVFLADFLREVAATELNMNAAERIFEFSSLEIENQGGIKDLRASWPEEGRIEVKDLEVGYAKDLPSILKGLTFNVKRNERIGVVGRTGAGKSTLALALLRILEARKGNIFIDDIDISTIKIHDLRTRLAIIPQDPTLFSGTIRSNLDPCNEFTDTQLKEALQHVHLISSDANLLSEPIVSNEEIIAEYIGEASTINTNQTSPNLPAHSQNTNIFLSLSSPIASAGSNISQGQKQLLCLARAILSRTKILLLDEATSAVDIATDILIQRSIREEFANTTLLVIAHRLSTIADFDRILVLRDGVGVEMGRPRDLMGVEGGVFRGMVERSGEGGVVERIIYGGNNDG